MKNTVHQTASPRMAFSNAEICYRARVVRAEGEHLSPDLGKLEHMEPRTLWESEASNFTPWLAENLSLLGEALGLDLELVQTEVAVGEFTADMEARDTGRDRQVIIENQLEPTDHKHLGQLLTYASGLDAAVIVWISPDSRGAPSGARLVEPAHERRNRILRGRAGGHPNQRFKTRSCLPISRFA
jgi:hypothetical protein